MILTDLFESQEIHNQDRLDQVLARCIEMVHEKNRANPKKYGKVAACIIDMKNRKVFGINSPGANGTRRHAERVAIDAYHKRYGKILPGAIIVTTLSPCNRPMAERDGPSCQDLLMQAGIEKVYSGYMDPSQHSDHPFTEETTKNDQLWEICKQLSDSFVHDDLTEGTENRADAQQVLDYIHGTHHEKLTRELQRAVLSYPQWQLKTVLLRSLHIPDQEYDDEEQEPEADPYNRVQVIDPEHAGEYSANFVDSRPIVVDREGWIIDGNHRAWAAAELLNKDSIKAWVPVKKQGVTEAFDQPYAVEWSKQNGDWHATADLDDGSELIVLFMAQGDNSWMVEFERDENMDITGEGDAPRVFATVLTAMQQFIAKRKPAMLNFSAEKEDDPTGSRARLYDRMIQRYITGSGYDLTRKDVPGGATYTLTKQAPGVAEGLDDNRVSFKVQKGKNKFATTLSVGVNPVGVYQYDADTGRSVAEVYPEFKGKGLGKLLVLHAIYTAAKLGLDFQEDESRTSEYDNVLDSLSSNGYIVDDDGYWYVTGEGEQYLQHSLKQGVAEGVYRGDWVRHPDNPWQIGQIQSIDNGQAAVIWKKTDKRKKAMSSTHAVDALQHARREFSQLTQPTHTPGMAENFADGKNPGRKGLAKRSGVNTKASVSTLRNVAKHSTGEKQRMAHWLANMKAGRAKARKK